MDIAISFKTSLDRARQRNRRSWPARLLYYVAVPLFVLTGFGLPAMLGRGKLEQLFFALSMLSFVVWDMSHSQYTIGCDFEALLQALEENIDDLRRQNSTLAERIAVFEASRDLND